MTRFHVAWMLAAGAAALAGCGPRAATAPATAPIAAEQLNRVVDSYWEAHLAQNPFAATAAGDRRFESRIGNPISQQHLADTLALERSALGELARVLPPPADADGRLTYEIFRRGRELAIEALTFPSELLPVNPFDSLPQQFAQGAEGLDPSAYESRIDDYVVWTDQAIANLRDGIRRGYVLQPELIERLLPQLAALGRDAPDNILFEPVRGAAAARGQDAVRQKLLPAYRALHDFLRDDYLPAAQHATPWTSWPLHQAWYAHLIHRYTGTGRSAQELHRIGRGEAERLRERIQGVLAGGGSLQREPGTAPESAAQVLAGYAALPAQFDTALRVYFGDLPQTAPLPTAVEAFREAAAPPAFYAPARTAGSGPVLYVNTAAAVVAANPGREALYLNAALPGHHLAYVRQRQNAALPRFRRQGAEPAFVEGWALYAEALGEEMGLYRDALSLYGALFDEWRHAAAMTVDSGIHAEGWSRRQALDYLHAQLPIDDATASDIVDRCLALPGESLAATSGALQLRALRQAVQERLGPRFDEAEFHRQVLLEGAMPLDLLEERLRRWADASR